MPARTAERTPAAETTRFPLHGWLGLALAGLFWLLNWGLSGARTQWGFFPMWLGYCLAMDGLVLWRSGTSLLERSLPKYLGLFLISGPAWWIFEVLNLRTQNWVYQGAAQFGPLEYAFWTTLSFTTVLPAVMETAELFAGFRFVKLLGRGPVIGAHKTTVVMFFAAGWLMLALLLIWPSILLPVHLGVAVFHPGTGQHLAGQPLSGRFDPHR